MRYINVGVKDPYNKSKKVMKEKIKVGPDTIFFYPTSMFDPDIPANFSAEWFRLNFPNDALTVVGPEPQTSRKWYATVSVRGEKLRVE